MYKGLSILYLRVNVSILVYIFFVLYVSFIGCFTVCLLVRAIIAPVPGSVQDSVIVRRKGGTLEIRFNVMANPAPTGFTWTRNGLSVSSGGGLMLALDSFVVNPIGEEHNGTYSLKVTNLAGSGYYNFSLIVQCKTIYLLVCVGGGFGDQCYMYYM